MLRTLHIIVRRRKQLADYTLNVVAYVTCLRERRRVRDRKRHIQKPRKRLNQICLAAAGRSDHKHVGLLNLHAVLFIRRNPLVVIIDRNRHHLFCLLLSDHIFIERRLDLVRCRDLLNVDNRL